MTNSVAACGLLLTNKPQISTYPIPGIGTPESLKKYPKVKDINSKGNTTTPISQFLLIMLSLYCFVLIKLCSNRTKFKNDHLTWEIFS